ncbi:unnamed protein product [Polarella glacialis]|uniref:Phospholipase B-like n=1 Tax=Polarella glacialis TaxID=89957 RepID=A0A813HLC2_POLGL|nr:unnamed protein product [Polarella glacialis]
MVHLLLLFVAGALALAPFAAVGARPESFDVSVYSVDLDADPAVRWRHVLDDFLDGPRGVSPFQQTYSAWLQGLACLFPAEFGTTASATASGTRLLAALDAGHPELAAELRTLSSALLQRQPSEAAFQAPLLAAAASIYVFANIAPRNTSDAPPPHGSACTSIVAVGPDGHVLHGRSLDFEPRDPIAASAVEVQFLSAGKVAYSCLHPLVSPTGLQWFTCLRPGAFSLSVNARSLGPKNEHNTTFDGLLARLGSGEQLLLGEVAAKAMAESDYGAALASLASLPVVSSNYFIVAGAGLGQGAIVTRFGNNSADADLWAVGSGASDGQPSWLRVQTNVDHWQTFASGAYATHRRQHAIDLLTASAASRNGSFVTDGDLWSAYLTDEALDTQSFTHRRAPEDTGVILRPTTIATLIMSPWASSAHPNLSRSLLNVSVWKTSPRILPPSASTKGVGAESRAEAVVI